MSTRHLPEEPGFSRNDAPHLGALHLPEPVLPPGPTPSQEPVHNLLRHLLLLHVHQVHTAADDPELLRPPHLWLTGPRGSGKTHVFRLAATEAGLPWVRADLSRYAVAGQPGRSLDQLFQEVVDAKTAPRTLNEFAGVVLLEGLDRELSAGSGDRARALQSEIASLADGRDLPVRCHGRTERRSSRRLLFVLTFSEGEAQVARGPLGFSVGGQPQSTPAAPARALLTAGVHPSLIDGAALQVALPTPTVRDLEVTLCRSGSALEGIRRLYASRGVGLELEGEARQWLAERAHELRLGGQGLNQVLGTITPRLVERLSSLPDAVGTVRLSSAYLAGTQPQPELIVGPRHPVTKEKATTGELPAHPDFPPETLPHRPTRPTHVGASSQGRLARPEDLQRWLAPNPPGSQGPRSSST